MTNEVVTLGLEDAVAVVTLNRPEVHNVVDLTVMQQLESRLDEIERDPSLRVLILTGAGTATFSAGGDLSYFDQLRSRDDALAMSRRMQAILKRLTCGRRPVIAAVNGSAWGGGCEILTACHLRIASEKALFGFRHAAMGVITGWGGGARLFRLVGRSAALRLLLTAETIDAARARGIGLVDDVVPHARVMTEARAVAQRIAANSPHSVRAFLDLAQAVDPVDEVAEEETRLFGLCWETDYFRDQVTAWKRKRRS